MLLLKLMIIKQNICIKDFAKRYQFKLETFFQVKFLA